MNQEFWNSTVKDARKLDELVHKARSLTTGQSRINLKIYNIWISKKEFIHTVHCL